MAQTSQVRGVATRIFVEDGITCIQYHDTVVVKFNAEKIILNSGGWRTSTTKARMNQASNQFDLGFMVYQKNHQWFVSQGGKEDIPFEDGMIVTR